MLTIVAERLSVVVLIVAERLSVVVLIVAERQSVVVLIVEERLSVVVLILILMKNHNVNTEIDFFAFLKIRQKQPFHRPSH